MALQNIIFSHRQFFCRHHHQRQFLFIDTSSEIRDVSFSQPHQNSKLVVPFVIFSLACVWVRVCVCVPERVCVCVSEEEGKAEREGERGRKREMVCLSMIRLKKIYHRGAQQQQQGEKSQREK